MANFADILSMKADEAEKPQAVPPGEYILRVNSYEAREVRSSKDGSTLFVLDVVFNFVEPGRGVDLEELERRKVDLAKRKVKSSFWLDPDSMWRLTDFLEKCGLDVAGREFKEILPEMKNRELTGVVTERASGKPGDDSVYNDVKAYVAL